MWTVGNNTTIDELLEQCDYHPMRDDPVFKMLVTLAEGAAKVHPNDRVTVFDDLVNCYEEDMSDLNSKINYLEDELSDEQHRANELDVEVKALRMHCKDNLSAVLYKGQLRGLEAELHDMYLDLTSLRLKHQSLQHEHARLETDHQTLTEKYNTWTIVSS